MTLFISKASLDFYKNNDVKFSLDLGRLSGRIDKIDSEF